MKIILREMSYILYGLAFGLALMPGLSWVTSQVPAFTDPTITQEPALAYYLMYYSSLNEPLTWLWLLAPYFLFLFIRTFLKSGGKKSTSPMDPATCEGESATVKVLIEEGADVNAKDAAGQTPLHLAAIKEKSDVVRLLIEGGADVDSSEPRLGFRPLHNAALEGNLDVCELLVKYGADLDAQTLHGDTALHLAAVGGHADIVGLLLQYRANMDIVDAEGSTALELAIEHGHEDIIDQFKQYTSSTWPYLRLANT